ncbi:nucleoid occlusion factor SlmA [uncultured Aquabacterium sp.]|jgi:TetR/AcrR family transcriptional regulator|uniref:nucleoid occlusion factor SlmA n=1 Tax=uncultured Aquabacterium sp. TaxID=158753 RepID=UPI00262D8FF6|nr:nucleoid occlusion factor SlmA [uncultured Aquabacterium sp.]
MSSSEADPIDDTESASSDALSAPPVRKRPAPGERRNQILQALAAMLEQPSAERITTAALAARLDVSEAALYRHFASKAQMYEGLIGFIEQSLFTLANQIVEREPDPARQIARVIGMVLQFGEKNPGMCRVIVGEALLHEHERLAARMNQALDRLESLLRQSWRALAESRGAATPTVEAQAGASLAMAVLLGRLQRYTRTGFARHPTEHLDATVQTLLS